VTPESRSLASAMETLAGAVAELRDAVETAVGAVDLAGETVFVRDNLEKVTEALSAVSQELGGIDRHWPATPGGAPAVEESDLVADLVAAHDEVLSVASEALGRAHLTHYAGVLEPFRRLSDLLAVVVDCLARRTLSPISLHAEAIADERFEAGFGIAEVQTAFNVLEEAIWHVVIFRLPPGQVVRAAGLVGTVLGVGKDNLARRWVSLATSQHVPSLDLAALFDGASS
jgi:hypothetical protein